MTRYRHENTPIRLRRTEWPLDGTVEAFRPTDSAYGEDSRQDGEEPAR